MKKYINFLKKKKTLQMCKS